MYDKWRVVCTPTLARLLDSLCCLFLCFEECLYTLRLLGGLFKRYYKLIAVDVEQERNVP